MSPKEPISYTLSYDPWTVVIKPTEPYVADDDGLRSPVFISATITHADPTEPQIHMSIVNEDSRPALIDLQFIRRDRGRPISGQVAEFPVDRFVAFIASAVALTPTGDGFEPIVGDVPLRPRRRTAITTALLEEVAEVYLANLGEGAPTKAVKEHFSVSHSTATRYVHEARDRKLLRKTTPGKAG